MCRRASLCALAVIVLAVSMAFLSGCKYSDVLTQHTEDPNAEVDENADPVYESNPSAELILDMAELSLDESDDENTQVAMLPHYDPDAPDNGPTKQRLKSPDTPHEEEASEGQVEGEADREGTGNEGEQGGEDSNSNEGDDEGTDKGTGEDLDDTNADEQTSSDEGGGSGETVVVNPDGTDEDTAKGTVAAVGEYATIAQMLGGAGALAACDQAWLDSCNERGLFVDELERVQVAFAGDGTEKGSCDVDTLVNTIQPSVVLWDSTANEPSLTDEDRAVLEEAGIQVQPVPHIGEQGTEDFEVKSAVAEVANVLAGASGLQYDPTDVLAQYNEFHDSVLKGCYDANKGYSYKTCDSPFIYLYQKTPLSGLNDSTTTRVTCVYVDSLMEPGVKSTTLDQSEGGRTLANDGKSLDLSDGVGLSATSSTQAYMLIDYYLQLAGVMNDAYDMAQPDSQGKRYVLMPGIASEFSSSGMYAKRSTSSAFFFNAGDGTVASNWHALGDSDFNVVLVANEEIQSAFVSSAAKPDGLYHMENPYRVIVVPVGAAGAWTEGHLDSFLLAPWAFRIQSEDNLDAAASYASSFYSKFLRCSDWASLVSNWDNAQTAG